MGEAPPRPSWNPTSPSPVPCPKPMRLAAGTHWLESPMTSAGWGVCFGLTYPMWCLQLWLTCWFDGGGEPLSAGRAHLAETRSGPTATFQWPAKVQNDWKVLKKHNVNTYWAWNLLVTLDSTVALPGFLAGPSPTRPPPHKARAGSGGQGRSGFHAPRAHLLGKEFLALNECRHVPYLRCDETGAQAREQSNSWEKQSPFQQETPSPSAHISPRPLHLFNDRFLNLRGKCFPVILGRCARTRPVERPGAGGPSMGRKAAGLQRERKKVFANCCEDLHVSRWPPAKLLGWKHLEQLDTAFLRIWLRALQNS